jgi:hypothetical protein
MRSVLRSHLLQQAELARSGTFSDNRVILFVHAEETIPQVHRELALRSLHSAKKTRSVVEVFEMLKMWEYLKTEHVSESISINTVVNDLEVVHLLEHDQQPMRAMSDLSKRLATSRNSQRPCRRLQEEQMIGLQLDPCLSAGRSGSGRLSEGIN